MKIAITGHTSGLGKSFYLECINRGHDVEGFSRSNGYDLRDYSKVGKMLDKIKDFDLFINNAKPDYSQSQILYRLFRSETCKIIVNIGSKVIESPPDWTDTFLLEYVTQKMALAHAVQVLSKITKSELVLINPEHLNDTDTFVKHQLDILKV
jgi:nucleoside-diphosphate-sugar epimerase